MTNWKRTNERPPGLQEFARWFRPEGIPANNHPSDIDGMWHSKATNSFLLIEFKPEGQSIPHGQRITMEGFSKLPGCTALLISDQRWDDKTGERVPDEEPLHLQVWIDGELRLWPTTLSELNKGLAAWYRREGWLVKHPPKQMPEFTQPGPTSREEMFRNLP